MWTKLLTMAKSAYSRVPSTKVGRGALGAGRFGKSVAGMGLKAFGGAGFVPKSAMQSQWEITDLRQRNMAAVERMLATVVANMDTFVHSIGVKIRGGPAADLRAVYYLACATAFGRYSRAVTRISGGYFQMSAHTDVSNKEVTIVIGYRTGGIGSLLRTSTGTFGTDRARTPHDVMYEGPDQVTIGASWMMPFAVGGTTANSSATVSGGILLTTPVTDTVGFTPNILVNRTAQLNTIQSVPWVVTYPVYYAPDPIPVAPLGPVTTATAPNPFRELPYEDTATQQLFLRRHAPVGIGGGGYVVIQRDNRARVPVLPDDGRLITTGETNFPAVQPPRPPVDALSRGGLVSLVAQALMNPGYLPYTPRRYDGNLAASSGLYVRPPGTVNAGVQVGNEWLDIAASRNPAQVAPPPPNALGAVVGGFGSVLFPTAPNVTE